MKKIVALTLLLALFPVCAGCNGGRETGPAMTGGAETSIPAAPPSATVCAATDPVEPPAATATDAAAPSGEDGGEARYVRLEHYGSTLTVRTEPSAKAKSAGTLRHGDEVTVLGEQGGWAKILYQGEERYVKAGYLADERPEDLKEPKSNETGAKPATDVASPVIKVYKARRTLELWDGKKRVAEWPMALGWEPKGHKHEEGDGKTPEGEYYVCTRNAASSYYKSLGVSYPGKADAEAAFETGLITAEQKDEILSAIRDRRCPPWGTPLGGAIMIHGGGGGNDWTAGCVAVDDEVMDILWECCELGTKILIYP